MRTWASAEFLVRPLEPVYFGKPQTFAAGEGHHGESEFPPSPMAFQGMIRSQMLRSVAPPLDLDDWSPSARQQRLDLVGGPEALPENWQIKGPLPARVETEVDDDGLEEEFVAPWVTAPLFLFDNPAGGAPLRAHVACSAQPALSDLGDRWLLGRPQENSRRLLGGWMGPANLRYALEGRRKSKWAPEQYANQMPPFVKWEAQAGIALERTSGTVQHGMLYQLRSLRFSDRSGLWGGFSGGVDERIPQGALTSSVGAAGRKGRVAAFEPAPPPLPDWAQAVSGQHLEEADPQGLFWLVLLTPLDLCGESLPTLSQGLPGGVTLRFRGAMLGRPVTYGGFSMAAGRSRANRPFVPAGSSWLFELQGGDAVARRETLRMLHNAHPLGDPEQARFGFGHTLVGIGPERPNDRAESGLD